MKLMHLSVKEIVSRKFLFFSVFPARAQNMKDRFAFLRRKSPDPSAQSKHLPADPPPRDVIENWKNGFSILLNDRCKSIASTHTKTRLVAM